MAGKSADILNLLDQVYRRDRRLDEMAAPRVGIFYVIDGELRSYSEEVRTAPLDHQGLCSAYKHVHYWRVVEKVMEKTGPGPEADYRFYPRGRVYCDAEKWNFHIVADPCVLSDNDLIDKVMTEFNLPRDESKLKKETVRHYRCHGCSPEQGRKTTGSSGTISFWKNTPMRRSLIMGMLCSPVGFAIGLHATPEVMGVGFERFSWYAGAAAFVTSAGCWWLIVERQCRRSVTRGVASGALSGFLAHFVCWYLLLIEANVGYWVLRSLAYTASADGPPVGLLSGLVSAGVMGLFSGIFIGWVTVPSGGIIGGGYAWLLGRRKHQRSA